MSFFNAMNINASALTAQRLRMDVISENIANATTTRTADGSPYKRKTVIMEEMKDTSPFSSFFDDALSRSNEGGGVRIKEIVEDESEGPKVYEPNHPDADADGYVVMPNVNTVVEMVNMIAASRSYEANVTAMGVTKAMVAKTMELGR